ncbi:hypothetical protein HZB89_01995 [archaeon]|nr:hypothetical protein [archaeon]
MKGLFVLSALVLLLASTAFAVPSANNGTEVSAGNANGHVLLHASGNAAFNRLLPVTYKTIKAEDSFGYSELSVPERIKVGQEFYLTIKAQRLQGSYPYSWLFMAQLKLGQGIKMADNATWVEAIDSLNPSNAGQANGLMVRNSFQGIYGSFEVGFDESTGTILANEQVRPFGHYTRLTANWLNNEFNQDKLTFIFGPFTAETSGNYAVSFEPIAWNARPMFAPPSISSIVNAQ